MSNRKRKLPTGFVTEYSYADLAKAEREQGHLFDGFMDEHDADCGHIVPTVNEGKGARCALV